jgi:SAM-dependent methyltransferase
VSSNQGYAAEAADLLRRYEEIAFADAHRATLPFLPASPTRVLDVGAGTGRDAAYFAAQGHSVLAVEPTAEMRAGAKKLHPSAAITWLDDALPQLARVVASGNTFGLIWLSAVWMHLDADERAQAMATLSALGDAQASLMITLRHGPVPLGRRMFAVTAAETIALAESQAWRPQLDTTEDSPRQPGIRWTALFFARAARNV